MVLAFRVLPVLFTRVLRHRLLIGPPERVVILFVTTLPVGLLHSRHHEWRARPRPHRNTLQEVHWLHQAFVLPMWQGVRVRPSLTPTLLRVLLGESLFPRHRPEVVQAVQMVWDQQ